MVKPSAKAPPAGSKESHERLPAYLHIVRTISDRIASGVYGPGAKLPSEAQLCVEFAVSPMTVRRALVILADKGVVAAEQGRGTFVRSFDLSDSVFTLEQLTGEYLPYLLEATAGVAEEWRNLALLPVAEPAIAADL